MKTVIAVKVIALVVTPAIEVSESYYPIRQIVKGNKGINKDLRL